MTKRIKRVALLLLGGYILTAGGLYFFQESLIFLSSKLEQNFEYDFANPVEELNLENDGVILNALHFKVENSKGVMLYFHGNAGDLSRWGEVVQPLLKYHYDIIVMDYRGYGKNGGEFSEASMYADAQVFYNYTKTLYQEKQIVVYGRSLGTVFATSVASKNNPSKLILETPFYSIQSVAKQRFPLLPVNWLLKYRFESYKLAKGVTCPTLILLSRNDEVVGYETGKRLSKEFAQSKTISLEKASHNNQSQYKLYWSELTHFLTN